MQFKIKRIVQNFQQKNFKIKRKVQIFIYVSFPLEKLIKIKKLSKMYRNYDRHVFFGNYK